MNQRVRKVISLLIMVAMIVSLIPAVIPAPAVHAAESRNLALHRAAYHSSADNYSDTGHLVTDGIISTGGSIAISASPTDSPGSEGPLMAFDGLSSTKWLVWTPAPNAGKAWLQVRLPVSNIRPVYSYSITSANDAAERDPRGWDLLGSNDGTSWDTLDTRASINWSNRLETRTFSIAGAPKSYLYYRLNITDWRGGSAANGPCIQLAEFDLLGADGKTILRTGTDNFSSMWKSKGASNESVYVDLGAVSDINQVKLYWMDDNYATQYDVQISNDAAGWTTVGSKTGGAGGAETIDFAVKQARYVRLLCRVSSGSCFTLSEMEVYGTNNLSYTLPPNPGEAADGTLPITGGN